MAALVGLGDARGRVGHADSLHPSGREVNRGGCGLSCGSGERLGKLQLAAVSRRRPPVKTIEPYKPLNKVRIVTAASLFDGHDAAINIMRRIIQSTGCEVIHLGHDRSAEEVVDTAIQEDAQAIALTSYQGGHMEYLKYMKDLLDERGAGNIKIFGGWRRRDPPRRNRGTAPLRDRAHLLTRRWARDGPAGDDQRPGLEERLPDRGEPQRGRRRRAQAGFRGGRACDLGGGKRSQGFGRESHVARARAKKSTTPVLGITGTGGSGKSSLVDELVRRFLIDFPDKTVGIVSRGSVQAQDRRCASGRPHPHEFHPQHTRVHALARHAPGESRAFRPRQGRDRYPQGGRLRSGDSGDVGDRAVGYRDRRSFRASACT